MLVLGKSDDHRCFCTQQIINVRKKHRSGCSEIFKVGLDLLVIESAVIAPGLQPLKWQQRNQNNHAKNRQLGFDAEVPD
jgi:hypothetical protein